MPTITPYFLTFQGGLHIGTRGTNLDEAGFSIPSDTLFSALFDAWRRKTGSSESFIKPFISEPCDPPFLLTSTFPFVGDMLFYPMPIDLTLLFKPETIQKRGKSVKHIRYISQGLLLKILEGQLLDDYLFPEEETSEPEKGAALQGNILWFSMEELEKLPASFQRSPGKRHALHTLSVWMTSRVPRVTVSRIESSTNLFHAGRVTFTKDCGLWFGVYWLKPEVTLNSGGLTHQQDFEQALAVLQDDGLGGERTAGYGAFKSNKGKPVKIGEDPKDRELAYLLSRYHPVMTELTDSLTGNPATAYNLIAVGGWLHSPDRPAQRRKRLYMVSEGSLINFPGFPAGDVTDVRPTYLNPEDDFPHPVYRYGLALPVAWPKAQVRS